jgi:hypothetical protein
MYVLRWFAAWCAPCGCVLCPRQAVLPPKVIEVRKVKLDETSQWVLNALFRSAQSILQFAMLVLPCRPCGASLREHLAPDGVACMLTLLRQCTDSVDLLPSSRIVAAGTTGRPLAQQKQPLLLQGLEAMFTALIATLGPNADESKYGPDACVCAGVRAVRTSCLLCASMECARMLA